MFSIKNFKYFFYMFPSLNREGLGVSLFYSGYLYSTVKPQLRLSGVL